MKITGEMKIQIFHRYNLRVAAACRTALDTEARSERRLTKRNDGFFAKTAESFTEADGGRRLALACRCRIDGGDKNQFAVLAILHFLKIFLAEFGFVLAVQFKVIFGNTDFRRYFFDRKHLTFLRNLNIRFHSVSST